MIGYVTMGMALIPMVVPMLGGLLDEVFGWQSIFAFTFVFGLAVTVLIWADLGETNRAPSSSMMAQVRCLSRAAALARRSGAIRRRRRWRRGPSSPSSAAGRGWRRTCSACRPPPSASTSASSRPATSSATSSPGATRRGSGSTAMMLWGGLVTTAGVLLALALLAAGDRQPARLLRGDLLRRGRQRPAAAERQRRDRLGASRTSPARPRGSAARCSSAAARRCRCSAGALLGPGTGAWPLLWVMLASSVLGLAATLSSCGRASMVADAAGPAAASPTTPAARPSWRWRCSASPATTPS